MAVRTALVPEDRASSALQLDGSLYFNAEYSEHLRRSPGSSGDLRKMTFSFWCKRLKPGAYQSIVTAYNGSNTDRIQFTSDNQFMIELKDGGSTEAEFHSDRTFSDIGGWYHFVVAFDTEHGTTADRCKVWCNGEQITSWDTNDTIGQNYDLEGFNVSGKMHSIGRYQNNATTGGDYYWDGYISEFHFVNDAQLDATYFGFTDPLTKTWRPKKYEGSHGTTGYYLPFDGSDEIGRDKSGNGNHWTPQIMRQSVTVDRATGALPILNTVCGGKVATVGVRTDPDAPGHLVYANPFCGIRTDVSSKINGGVSAHPLSMTGSAPGDDQNRVSPQNFYGPAFYFDGNDCVYSADSSDWDLGSGDFTAELWFKRNRAGHDEWLFTQSDGVGSNTPFGIHIDASSHVIEGRVYHGSTETDIAGITQLNDKKWYHAAWVRDGNTMRLFLNGVQENSTTISGSVINGTSPLLVGAVVSDGTAGFQGWIQDVRLYKGVAKYKHNFVPAATDPQIMPESPSGLPTESWPEIECGSVSFDGTDDYLSIADHDDFDLTNQSFTIDVWAHFSRWSSTGFNTILWRGSDGTASNTQYIIDYKNSTKEFRFITAVSNSHVVYASYAPSIAMDCWHHLAVCRSGSDLRLFVDGVQVGATHNIGSATIDNDNVQIFIGKRAGNNDRYVTGFLSNLRMVVGTALYTSNFVPSEKKLTQVTNTKLLCFQNKTVATIGFSPTTITATGSTGNTFNPFKCDTIPSPDTYPTLNYLAASDVKNGTIMYKNLFLEGSNYQKYSANIRFGPGAITDGQYYWEIQASDGTYPGYMGITGDFEQDSGEIWGNPTKGWNASTYYKQYTQNGAYIDDARLPYYDGITYGFAVDATANKLHYYRDGIFIYTDTTIPDATTTAYEPFMFCTNDGSGGSGWCDMEHNFGQKPFKFPPPDGFRSLAYGNLPQPEFPRPDTVVGIVTYTGNGSTGQSIPLNFQPDFVLTKKYNDTESWGGFDSISGTGKRWTFNDTHALATEDVFPSFNEKGFSVTGTGGGATNDNNASYVAYAWKAGGNKATWNVDGLGYASVAAAGLDGGSIDPNAASVNTKAGFSIIKYTATSASPESFAHGLTRKPEFMFCKKTGTGGSGGARGWSTFHHSLAAGKVLFMDTNGDVYNEPNFWNSVGGITDSLVYVGGDYNTGEDGEVYMNFAWHSVPGLQQFGSYNGNGSTDGCYVPLGFRPTLLFLKMTNADDNWAIMTPKLNSPLMNNSGYCNTLSSHMRCDTTGAEYNPGGSPAVEVDFLSSGFKHKNTSGQVNGDGNTYIYCAWAESPLNNLYGGVPNAR